MENDTKIDDARFFVYLWNNIWRWSGGPGFRGGEL